MKVSLDKPGKHLIWPGVMQRQLHLRVLKASEQAVGTVLYFQNWVQGDRIELARNRIISNKPAL